MARYTGPRLRVVRRLQTNLPGLVSTTVDELRRPYPPGQHGQSRKKVSDYGLRLMEKQKLRFHYGLLENQLRRVVENAARSKGNTGDTLLQLLERRLDNVVFRGGFAPSIPAARQMVRHGHVHVNGRRLDIPSAQLRVGDTLELRPNSGHRPEVLDRLKTHVVPDYLGCDATTGTVKVGALPTAEHVPFPLQVQLVIEFYSGN